MFKAETMRPQDYTFASKLANTMHWNSTNEDFAFNNMLEPDGCFILFDDSVPIGIATCICYGRIGWFGNLVVKDEYRKKGAGTFLVKHAINYLHSRGVRTIGLYAYPYLVDFYGTFGFMADADFAVLNAKNVKVSLKETLTPIREQNLQEISRLDAGCFGGDRKRLLKSIILDKDNVGYFVSEDKKIVGYAVVKIYAGIAELGSLVCESNNVDVALRLLNGLLSKVENTELYVYLPKKQKALIDYLFEVGFEEEFSLTRMFLPRNLSKNCIYVAESLERG